MGSKGDDLPEIELVDDDTSGGTETEAVVTSGPRPRLVLFLAATAALLGVGVVVSNGWGSESEEEALPSSTTSTVPSTTTAEHVAARGSYLRGRPLPVFEEAVRGSLLLGGGDTGWRQVDLSTGWVSRRPELDGVAPEGVVPVAGALVYLDGRFDPPWLFPLPSPQEPALPIRPLIAGVHEEEAQPVEYVDVVSAGSSDRLWVITRLGRDDDAGLYATLVNVDGRRLDGPFRVPAPPIAGTNLGVVFNAAGHGFLVDGDGRRDLGDGEVYAAAAFAVGRVHCNEFAQCHQQLADLHDPMTAMRGASMPTAAAAAGSVTMAVTDDGSLAALPVVLDSTLLEEAPNGRTASLYISRPGTQTRVVVDNARAGPVWLPDGEGVLMLTGDGLVRYAHTERLDAEGGPVPGLLHGRATALLYAPPATNTSTDTLPTYELHLPGARLRDDSTSEATRKRDVTMWANADTYLSLSVGPGVPGRTADADTPVEWLPRSRGEAWFGIPRDKPTAVLRWIRPSGEHWTLRAHWRNDTPPAGEREQLLRLWSQGISAEDTEGSRYRLHDGQMRRIASDPGGQTRARARAWDYDGHELTLFVIENSSATMLRNLLATGHAERVDIPGRGDVWATETRAGWAVPGDRELWATLSLPRELAGEVERVVQQLDGPTTTPSS